MPGQAGNNERGAAADAPGRQPLLTDDRILVLNKSWAPIAATTARRGISLVFRGHARIVETSNFELFDWERWLAERSAPHDGSVAHIPGYIHSVNLKIMIPDAVTLSRFNGVPSQKLPFSRRTLLRRDNFQCQYCGKAPGVKSLTIDHVLPRSRGGGTTWLNCVVSCVNCNVGKGNRTPEEAGIRLLRPPFRPNWIESFSGGRRVPASWMPFLAKVGG